MHAPSAAHTYTHIHTAFDTHIHTAFDREDSAHSKRNPPRSTQDPGTYSLPRQTAGQRRQVSCVRCQRVLRSKPRVSVHASVCQAHVPIEPYECLIAAASLRGCICRESIGACERVSGTCVCPTQTPRQTRTQTQSKTLMPTQTHNTRARAHTHMGERVER